MSKVLTPEQEREKRMLQFKHLSKNEQYFDVWCSFKPSVISYQKYVGYRVFQLHDTTCFDCLGVIALWGQDAATRMMDLELQAIEQTPPQVVDEFAVLKMSKEDVIEHLAKQLFNEDITMLTSGLRRQVMLARTRLNLLEKVEKGIPIGRE